MKTISLRQPWLWIVLWGGKRIENRTWNTHYRGELLLHAAKTLEPDEYADVCEAYRRILKLETWQPDHIPAFGDSRGDSGASALASAGGVRSDVLYLGGICGKARIVDIIPPGQTLYAAGLKARGVDTRFWFPEQYGFVLEDVEPVAFTPARGFPSLFDFDEKLLRLPC